MDEKILGWRGRLLRSLVLTLTGLLCFGRGAAADGLSAGHQADQPSFAFYYGPAPIPVAELSAFDNVVVEPDSGFSPDQVSTPHTDWLAYASVGEVTRHRSYFSRIPKSWLIGGNSDWGSAVVDQAAPGWPQFFVDQVIAPLWARGYRGFFLDTLDSFQLVAKTDAARQRQIAGLTAVIHAIKARYPAARLVFNRGFEILPQVHGLVYAVSFESLYRGWDQGKKRFTEVPQNDRDWLLGQVDTIRNQYHLPVVSIDYCAAADRRCARDTAARIAAQGIVPYVTDPGLTSVGTGADTRMPRRILMLQDPPANTSLNVSDGVLYMATPLNYLGYRLDYVDVNHQPLPDMPLADRYAGVVIWLNNPVARPAELRAWVERQIADGVKVVFMNSFGMPVAGQFGHALGLESVGTAPQGALHVAASDPAMMGYEMPPTPDSRDYTPLRFSSVRVSGASHPLLTLASGDFRIDAAAITPWGGYVMRPFGVFTMDDINQARWVVQPFAFLRAALRLPDMPVPDPTTENGRRLFMSHIDGDGFASKLEFPSPDGDVYSGEAIRRVLQQYGLPVTVSVIEGEVNDEGPHPAEAPHLRVIARKIFELPNVEMASHTYTHPLPWMKVTGAGVSTNDYSAAEGSSVTDSSGLAINVPGYTFNLDREIGGSVAGITREMAPPGKKVEVLLWSGDCQVPAMALQRAYAAGVMNLNGGDTLITRSNPSLTAVAPQGVMKDGYYQVFAPNQNEEMYTQLWQGPFYGFRRVLETFDMTERPLRLKPIDVYYHFFTGTKLASLKALETVYSQVAAEPINPVFVSEYAHKVLDTQQMSVAREADGRWVIRSAGQLRTVRLAPGEAPDLRDAEGVAGFLPGPGGVYVHLSGSEAKFRVISLADAERLPLPRLASANGRIDNVVRTADGLRFELSAHVAPHFAVAPAGSCQVRVDGRALTGAVRDGAENFSLGAVGVPVAQPLVKVLVDVRCRT